LVALITEAVKIPTVGIGRGHCDGQVLVLHDMSGCSAASPRSS
jgi:ketopantoate hydroxymethyltransferase